MRQTPPRHSTCSTPPELQSSIPRCTYACSASPELLRQTPRRPSTCRTPPELQSSILLRGNTPAAHLQSSRGKLLDVPTPAARLQSSAPRCPYARSAPPELHTSTSLHLHTYSPPPELIPRGRARARPFVPRGTLPPPKFTTVPTSSRACYHLRSLLPSPKLAAASRACYRIQNLLPPPKHVAASRACYR